MNIDDIADRRTNRKSPGERFRDDWLDDLPTNQWPSYIDESAQLVANGIFIGETDLTQADFGFETGSYYRRGLAETVGVDASKTSLPLGNYSSSQVGRVAWAFNRLREELRTADHTSFENPSRAIEAAINKTLLERLETGSETLGSLETIRLPEHATVSTLVSEVFCRPRSESYVDLLLETVNDRTTDSLLSRIEEPRMVTPLWEHQRKALDEWLAHGCRGYVDMATATGKTVLGLAAIAHQFGALHPDDRGLADDRARPDQSRRATVVLIAHRDLILDQWKREFDTHLNIPEQSTTDKGQHTARFEWGNVHFWTPSRLQNADLLDEEIDLVVLDETHHYLGSSGFGALLDQLDGDVLALSGSIDATNARTLERRDIPKLFKFTLHDGQRAGVVPRCDWDVVLTPYENQARLADVTKRCRRGMARYADGVDVPDSVDTETDTLAIKTLSDARSVAQSAVGRELKETDKTFREFASAVMSRQLTQYNLSPALSTVTHLVLDNLDQHKCVVLLETAEEISHITDELDRQLGDAYDSLITVLDDGADLDAVEQFDHDQVHGAILGIAQTLGEGVDIETADICINRGRGQLSRSLVQRMGRILRNPTGDKHARFYHVLGVPTRDEATLADEDGISLLETTSQLLDWGEGFNARPVFRVDDETTLTAHDVAAIEQAGADAIDARTPDQYDPPTDDGVREALDDLRGRIEATDGSALLAIERPDPDEDSRLAKQSGTTPDSDSSKATSDDDIQFVAADGGGIELTDWLYDLAAAASDDADEFVEDAVRSYAQTALAYPSADVVPATAETHVVELNPALDAVLTAYADDGSKAAAVHAAVGANLPDDLDSVRDEAGLQRSTDELATDLAKMTGEADA